MTGPQPLPLPDMFLARCTDPACSWRVETPDRDYRDTLTTQHAARYGHAISELDLTTP